jgi:hypothetical protein
MNRSNVDFNVHILDHEKHIVEICHDGQEGYWSWERACKSCYRQRWMIILFRRCSECFALRLRISGHMNHKGNTQGCDLIALSRPFS